VDSPRHPPSPLRAVEFVADPPLVERAPDAVEALTPLLLGVICGHTPHARRPYLSGTDMFRGRSPRLGGSREILAGGHALPLRHVGRAGVLQQFGFHESSKTGGAPDRDGRGLDCPVWVVRPLGPHRFYSTSGPLLGGRDDHLPAGSPALAAGGRRGDIVDRELPVSAARAAGRGVVL